jgi:hypothetical protein
MPASDSITQAPELSLHKTPHARASLYLEGGGGACTPAQTDRFCALARWLVGSGISRFRLSTSSASPTLCL